MLVASARTEIAEYLSTVIYVYTLIIFVYIVTNLLFAAGLRPPYSRTTDRVLGFLRDVCEPFLRIFRRLSIFSLYLINLVVVQGIIHG